MQWSEVQNWQYMQMYHDVPKPFLKRYLIHFDPLNHTPNTSWEGIAGSIGFKDLIHIYMSLKPNDLELMPIESLGLTQTELVCFVSSFCGQILRKPWHFDKILRSSQQVKLVMFICCMYVLADRETRKRLHLHTWHLFFSDLNAHLQTFYSAMFDYRKVCIRYSQSQNLHR